jgi:hypothetical protein
MGRPKGSKNKKTLEKEKQLKESNHLATPDSSDLNHPAPSQTFHYEPNKASVTVNNNEAK